jgi:purine-cytosine permease-like protein
MMRKADKTSHLSDTNQSWWDLVAIQFSGWMGVPVLASSILILQQNSFLGAVFTIIVGNAIMWFIRLGIISMSSENRQSTLDISRTYMGSYGGYCISILLLVSTFAWYVAQTTLGGNNLIQLISIHENPQINQFVQMSVFLGIISAFLCMEGIVLLRKLSIFAFPFLLISFFIILITIPDHAPKTSTQTISLSGLSLFLATNLGLSSDLPTFFRHGQSWATSIKALTIIQILNVFFGIFSLFFGSLVINGLEINQEIALLPNHFLLRYSLIIFIFFSVICSNVANVYSASVGWEIIAPSILVGRKEYLIMGLSLTIIFISISNLFSTDLLLEISDASLVNLSITLIIGYLISKKLKKPPSPYLQFIYFSAWALSSLFNFIQFSNEEYISPLSVSFFTIVIVIGLGILGKKIRYRTS